MILNVRVYIGVKNLQSCVCDEFSFIVNATRSFSCCHVRCDEVALIVIVKSSFSRGCEEFVPT